MPVTYFYGSVLMFWQQLIKAAGQSYFSRRLGLLCRVMGLAAGDCRAEAAFVTKGEWTHTHGVFRFSKTFHRNGTRLYVSGYSLLFFVEAYLLFGAF